MTCPTLARCDAPSVMRKLGRRSACCGGNFAKIIPWQGRGEPSVPREVSVQPGLRLHFFKLFSRRRSSNVGAL